MTRWTRVLTGLALALVLAVPPACTKVENPATGETEYTTLSPEEERKIGEQQHPQILQRFGGEYREDELNAYVERIGNELAAVSDMADLDFTFTLLDSEVVNAFALPGGYVYLTRGLLALAENEAEMAGVLGHEIGHVTARHSAQRQTQATGAGLLATLGTIGAAILGGQAAAELTQQLAGAGAQAYLASYSRDQELEADRLGVRYLQRAGYDPRAMATFLQKLNDQSELQRKLAGQEGDPGLGWFATHPRTLDRVEQAIEEVGATAGEGRIGRDAYLAQIDGMIYGENPAQGFVRGNRFIHPELRFAFEAPEGFSLQNTPAAVIGKTRQGHVMIFDMAKAQGQTPGGYVGGPGLRAVAEALNADGVSRPRNVQTLTVDGLPAATSSASIRKGGQQADIGLAAIQAEGDQLYRFVFLSPGSMSRGEARAYQATVDSFRRLSEAEAAQFEAQRIRIATVESGASEAAFARRMAVEELPEAHFEVLNALTLQDGLSPGEQVKLIAR